MSVGKYLGLVFVTYLGAYLVASVATAAAMLGAADILGVTDIPLFDVPIAATAAAVIIGASFLMVLVYAFFWLLHLLVMVVVLGIRQRFRVRTPLVEILFSGGMGAGLGRLLSVSEDAAWNRYTFGLSLVMGILIGLSLFVVVRARARVVQSSAGAAQVP